MANATRGYPWSSKGTLVGGRLNPRALPAAARAGHTPWCSWHNGA